MNSIHLPVLVVDDHPVNRLAMRMLLSRFGLEADVAANGIEALEAVRRESYGLILMDIMMPGISGYEVARKIREMEFGTGKHTPIVACTALDMKAALQKCMESGMDDYVMKPLSKELLEQKLESWMQVPIGALLHQMRQTHHNGGLVTDPINRARLRILYGTEELDDLLGMFLSVTDVLLSELKSAIAHQDDSLFPLAHELRGSSLTVSAGELAELSNKLAQAAEQHDWPAALKIYVALEHAFSKVREFVSAKESAPRT